MEACLQVGWVVTAREPLFRLFLGTLGRCPSGEVLLFLQVGLSLVTFRRDAGVCVMYSSIMHAYVHVMCSLFVCGWRKG